MLEMVIATSLLTLALAAFLASLGSSESATEFATSRNRSLDELRLAASAFSREARQATSALVDPGGTSVTFSTYVNGVLKPNILWRTISAGGEINLERVDNGVSPATVRIYPLRLTTANVFIKAPGTLTLNMATMPKPKFPPVVLTTEVSLRNAS